jgi:beta-galactosidase
MQIRISRFMKNNFRLVAIKIAIAVILATTAASRAAADASVDAVTLSSTPRTVADFDNDWRFSKGDFPNAAVPAFDDSAWRLLNLPHDWSSEGPFGLQYASGTGFAPGGIGWYRKHFRLDSSAANKIVTVEFDGIYDHSEVWINGHFIGGRPYGYSSFECELTPLLKFGAQENVVAVRVDHSRFADSRWYTGSGIYRHVRLRVTDPLHSAHWGNYITTPEVKSNAATVRVETKIENAGSAAKQFSLELEIISPDGNVAANVSSTTNIASATNQTIVQELVVTHPELWSVDSPKLYMLRSRVALGANTIDESSTPFGIRTIHFDAEKGFFLNGQSLKIKGVCIHHEAGCLGAAVPEKVWERRLRTLKEIGVNAIRTSHNPPAPELLDLCDRLGLLVKDEAFDEFTPAKNKWMRGWNSAEPSRFGYAEDFAEWSVRDISDMVRRDRNHPSIILWSIGNEIDYANDPFSHPVLGENYHPENPPAENLPKLARPLIAAVKSLDTTRPVTAALATVAMSDAVGLPELLDAVGYNYQEQRYAADHAKYPKRIIFGSETSHQFSAWRAVLDNDFISGQFLWTGIDYLGEAREWPNRGSSAGLLDLCGFKKPLAWFRQSLWSDKPMIYLCAAPGRNSDFGPRGRSRGEETWNWPSNSIVNVRCFTTCEEVVLLLNGKNIGTKKSSDAFDGVLTWQIPFEPGELKAIGHNAGKDACEFILKTAGAPSRIELLPYATELRANGSDVAQIEFRVVDANGVRIPDATNEVTFSADGPAELIGIENGDLNSAATGKDAKRSAYHGRGLAFFKSGKTPGKIIVTATSRGLEPAAITLDIE